MGAAGFAPLPLEKAWWEHTLEKETGMGLQSTVCWGKSRAGGKGLSLMGMGMMPEEWKA